MKIIKKITAFAVALLMLIPTALPTSAYIFESMDEYTEYFTELATTYQGSYAWVSITDYGGYGSENDFLGKTVFVDSSPVGVFTAKAVVSVAFSTNNNNEVYHDCDCKTSAPYAEGIEAVVDGSVVEADYNITSFEIVHTLYELFTNSAGLTSVFASQEIVGVTTS